MKRAVPGLLLLLLVAVIAQAQSHKRGVSISTNDDTLSDDCSEHLRVNGSEFQNVVRDEETRSIPNQPLTVHAEQNGGIQVTTWDKPEFSVKLCKQVATDDNNEASRVLGETKLNINGGTVTVNAPHSEGNFSLGTLVMIKAPRDANVNLSVQNGGVSLSRFSGTAEAHAMNGGISLKQATGKLNVNAQNGGVSIKDCGGDITAVVENGGLSIHLPQHWEGKGLDARTENGGLMITVPANFSSGLEVSSSRDVSVVCRASACDNGQRTWENGQRMFRIGNAPVQIRATTVHGGIVIKEPREELM
jgi:putative adhesin